MHPLLGLKIRPWQWLVAVGFVLLRLVWDTVRDYAYFMPNQLP